MTGGTSRAEENEIGPFLTSLLSKERRELKLFSLQVT